MLWLHYATVSGSMKEIKLLQSKEFWELKMGPTVRDLDHTSRSARTIIISLMTRWWEAALCKQVAALWPSHLWSTSSLHTHNKQLSVLEETQDTCQLEKWNNSYLERHYITVTFHCFSSVTLPLSPPLIHCFWQTSSLPPASRCLTGAEWQRFELLLLRVEACIPVTFVCMSVCLRVCVCKCKDIHMCSY